jgi:hypothetical protein
VVAEDGGDRVPGALGRGDQCRLRGGLHERLGRHEPRVLRPLLGARGGRRAAEPRRPQLEADAVAAGMAELRMAARPVRGGIAAPHALFRRTLGLMIMPGCRRGHICRRRVLCGAHHEAHPASATDEPPRAGGGRPPARAEARVVLEAVVRDRAVRAHVDHPRARRPAPRPVGERELGQRHRRLPPAAR